MSDFKVTVGYEFEKNESLCFTKNGQIKTPDSNSISEYECFTCGTKVQGSFLFIRKLQENQELEIRDVIVEGNLLHSSGNSLKQNI